VEPPYGENKIKMAVLREVFPFMWQKLGSGVWGLGFGNFDIFFYKKANCGFLLLTKYVVMIG